MICHYQNLSVSFLVLQFHMINYFEIKINEKLGFILDKTCQPEVSQEFRYNQIIFKSVKSPVYFHAYNKT